MNIKVGQIIQTTHENNNGKIMVHPFLIINITKNHIYALQCSSVKEEDGESYFSKNNIDYYELKYFDTQYVTHVRLAFQRLDSTVLRSILCEPNWNDYNRIAQELLLMEWENNDEWNDKQIKQQVWSGIDNFSREWIV
ncbi:MAG: hypothetical protein GY679_03950 [Mycoplasma sp.]|nr:hypothetical protein [Mycoplasma sp.]